MNHVEQHIQLHESEVLDIQNDRGLKFETTNGHIMSSTVSTFYKTERFMCFDSFMYKLGTKATTHHEILVMSLVMSNEKNNT